MNLALCIFNHILYDEQAFTDERGISLAKFRLHYQIPRSTFFRAVDQLIKSKMIDRIKRDTYVIHGMLVEEIYIQKSDYDGRQQRKLRI